LIFLSRDVEAIQESIMIAGLNQEQIRTKLNADDWAIRLLAKVICSTYWGGVGVDLHELGRLDAENWTLAAAIMGYRRTPDWDDNEFYTLAVWCLVRHKLGRTQKPTY
jgi:hypothetical protein